MHDPEFQRLMKAGISRVHDSLDRDLPRVASNLQRWMKDLAGSDEPADYFLHPLAFPLMLLPWWLERQFRGHCDTSLQTNLIFSNACMYYYVRMVDNVMDGHATVEPKLLPAAGYFVNQFEGVYHDYFGPSHQFWDFFRHTWAEFCDVTAADGQLQEINRETFESLVGRKVCAAKIGVAAVCYLHGRTDPLLEWNRWIDVFGCWHLFREDLFDWQQDLDLGVMTYFLSQAKRRKNPGEAEVSWLARAGLDWAYEQLAGWMEQLRRMSAVSPEVLAYLDVREAEVLDRKKRLRPALDFVEALARSRGNG